MDTVKILLVDADTKTSTALEQQLTKAQYDACTVATAEEALHKLQAEESPDLLLICLDIAAARDYALLQEIKTQYPQKQIVLASNHQDHEHTADTTYTGTYTILPKPVDVELLIQSLQLNLADKMDGAMVAATLAQAGAFEEAEATLEEMEVTENLVPPEKEMV